MKSFSLRNWSFLLVMGLCVVIFGCEKEECDCPFCTGNGNQGGGQLIPEYAVDLGLPTGTLWADRNIGAECPEDQGNYFAWGETTPKNTYDWSTYKWCNGTKDSQTKYCTTSRYGTVDNLTILEPEDDAATANWGDRWRMPTSLEFEELLTYCTWEWTTQNNVIGYKVAGRNGNSIFLPAHLKVVSSVYWSKSLGELQSYGAWGLYFHDAYCGMFDYISRDTGCTVRAVVK